METQIINKINDTICEFFNKNPHVNSIRAKELMPYFIEAGVFAKDHKEGLPIRDLLRVLDELNKLYLIPYIYPERKIKNTFWYFINVHKLVLSQGGLMI